jgi:hypothetical protein
LHEAEFGPLAAEFGVANVGFGHAASFVELSG